MGAIIRGQAINRGTATIFEEIRPRWFSLTWLASLVYYGKYNLICLFVFFDEKKRRERMGDVFSVPFILS